MSYAVRNDQLGFRCVDGPGDVAKGEFFVKQCLLCRGQAQQGRKSKNFGCMRILIP